MSCAKVFQECSNDMSDDEWDSLVCNLEEETDDDSPTGGAEEGNTITAPPPTPKVNPAKYWCFTLCNYADIEYDHLCARCSEMYNIDWAIISKEVAPETGTPHLQGALAFKKKSRPSGLKASSRIHWERSVSNKADQIRYCMKEDKTPFIVGLPQPTRILEKANFFGWQRDLDNLLNEPVSDRDIHWITGAFNTGKTTFCKYLTLRCGWQGPLEGTDRHIKSMCAEHQDANGYIIHLPYEKQIPNSFYYALESIKDGYYMSHFGTKGTYPVCLNPARIIVFANCLPKKKAHWHETKYKFYQISTNLENLIEQEYTKNEIVIDKCVLDVGE